MTRALVTGSTGFVGSNLVLALNQRGIEVVGLRRSTSPDDALEGLQMKTVVGDMLKPETLQAAVEGVDWVFHVAAISDYAHQPADLIYRVNVEGTRNMLQAAQKAGVKRFILTGSVAALGIPRPGKPLLDEQDTFNLRPEDFPYGHSKHLADQVMMEYAERGMYALSVLPAVVMGPRDLKFISGEIIVQALKGLPVIPPGGVSYIDVRDCAEGHIAAAERGRAGERYILAGHNLTHQQALTIISRVLGRKAPRLSLPRWSIPTIAAAVGLLRRVGFKLPIDPTQVRLSAETIFCDNSKAMRELGLHLRPFEESVHDAYRWYIDHRYLERRGISIKGKE